MPKRGWQVYALLSGFSGGGCATGAGTFTMVIWSESPILSVIQWLMSTVQILAPCIKNFKWPQPLFNEPNHTKGVASPEHRFFIQRAQAYQGRGQP